jgi:hypothetical protein
MCDSTPFARAAFSADVFSPEGKRAYFMSLNRNKRNLVIDVMEKEGRRVFYDLVKKSDVVADNLRPGVEKKPDCIAVDAGSTDTGPFYLGAGKSFTSRVAVKRDLKLMLEAALELHVPCIIGTAGGCGAREHVAWNESIIREIAEAGGYSL